MSDAGNMGNSENTGNTTGIHPIHGKGSGTHFSNEELLAYLHKDVQGSTLWNIQHQHISNCSACSTQLDELEQSEQLLKVAVHSSHYGFYASITESVMARTSAPDGLTQTPYRFGKRGSSHLRVVPVALVVAALLIITFGSLLLTKLPTIQGHMPVAASPVVKPTGIIVPRHFNATPTKVPTAVSTTAVVPPMQTTMVLWNCTSNVDLLKQHMRICGDNFHVGDNVVFTLVNSSGKPIKQVGPVQVVADGTFEQIIAIHSCKDVPSFIYAQDISMTTAQKVAPLSISYGKC